MSEPISRSSRTASAARSGLLGLAVLALTIALPFVAHRLSTGDPDDQTSGLVPRLLAVVAPDSNTGTDTEPCSGLLTLPTGEPCLCWSPLDREELWFAESWEAMDRSAHTHFTRAVEAPGRACRQIAPEPVTGGFLLRLTNPPYVDDGVSDAQLRHFTASLDGVRVLGLRVSVGLDFDLESLEAFAASRELRDLRITGFPWTVSPSVLEDDPSAGTREDPDDGASAFEGALDALVGMTELTNLQLAANLTALEVGALWGSLPPALERLFVAGSAESLTAFSGLPPGREAPLDRLEVRSVGLALGQASPMGGDRELDPIPIGGATDLVLVLGQWDVGTLRRLRFGAEVRTVLFEGIHVVRGGADLHVTRSDVGDVVRAFYTMVRESPHCAVSVDCIVAEDGRYVFDHQIGASVPGITVVRD